MNRVAQLSKDALLKKKLSIIIFPEGTRTNTGSLGEFKTGAAYLAKKARDRMATKAEMPETAAPVASSIKDVIKQKISENPKAAMAAAGLGALGVGAGAYHRYKSRKNQG